MSGGSCAVRRLPLVLLHCVALARFAAAGLLFTEQPIVRFSPALGVAVDDLFGYSTVLHRTEDSGDFDQIVSKSRILVGAPNGTYPGGLSLPVSGREVNYTGLVYSCPVEPGTCEGLMGTGNGNDMRLFDSEENLIENRLIVSVPTNVSVEEKSGQFMGATLVSTGDHFMACAPRWINRFISFDGKGPFDNTRSHGRCYMSPKNLTNFITLRPCYFGTSQTQAGEGYCMAGTSASLYETQPGNTSVFLGGPPYDSSNGGVFHYNIVDNVEPTEKDDDQILPSASTPNIFLYTGMAVAHGRILSSDKQDLIYSLPKAFNYSGSVEIYSFSGGIDHNLTVRGEQMGEYFGWTITTADLNGDSFDELLVGAPLYSTTDMIERGRVFVYQYLPSKGTMSEPIVIYGNAEYGRFGFDITNLGDINNDGFDDVAISAPLERFGEGREGAVYIFYGAGEELIKTTPSETITAAQIVEAVDGLSRLESFGYSVSSSVDIDGNTYKDLVIGGYKSQVVVVLRTQSTAHVNLSVVTSVTELELETKNCTVGGTYYACFNITVSANFTGPGLDGRPLITQLQIRESSPTADTEKRLFLVVSGGMVSEIDDLFHFSSSGNAEQTITLYVKNDIIDRRNRFSFDVTLRQRARVDRVVTGNDSLIDLRDFPILNVMPSAIITGELPLGGCGTDKKCQPKLSLQLNSVHYISSDRERGNIVAGAVTRIEVLLDYSTNEEDALNSRLNLNFSSSVLDAPSQISLTMNQPPYLQLPSAQCREDSVTADYTCLLQTHITESDGTLQVNITIPVHSGLVGDEGNSTLTIAIQDEANADPDKEDNIVIIPLIVTAEALFSVSGNMIPNTSTYEPGKKASSPLVFQRVTTRTQIRNNGPSAAPNSRLTVYVPGQSRETGDYYYIYLTSVQPTISGDSNVTMLNCTGTINPDNFEESQALTSSRKRRYVPVMERLRRLKDGETKAKTIRKREIHQTVDCSVDQTQCSRIVCDIDHLSRQTTLLVDVVGYIDGRYFSSQKGNFLLKSYAVFEVLDKFFTNRRKHTQVSNHTLTELEEDQEKPPPIWVYFVSIIGGIIVMVIIVILLYLVGFFRLKRRKERLEKERASAAIGVAVTTAMTGPTSPNQPHALESLDSKPLDKEIEEPDIDVKPEAVDEDPDETEL